MHSLSCHISRLLVSIVLCFTVLPVSADFDETYSLEIGGTVVGFDTSIRVNSRDDSVDKEIDLEDDLGVSSEVRMGSVKGSWRMADRHRLTLLYAPVNRSSEKNTSKDIEVGGSIIRAGAFIGVSTKSHVFDIEYLYSFYKRPDLELGVSAGIYWMNVRTEITAAGLVLIDGSTQDELRTDFAANQRFIAPLPLIGFSAGYEITPKWLTHAYARYLDVTISDIEGRILSLNLNTEYYITDYMALGVGYAAFDLSVSHSGVVTFNSLKYSYSGLRAYLKLRY
jgi:hypothetical protein